MQNKKKTATNNKRKRVSARVRKKKTEIESEDNFRAREPAQWKKIHTISYNRILHLLCIILCRCTFQCTFLFRLQFTSSDISPQCFFLFFCFRAFCVSSRQFIELSSLVVSFVFFFFVAIRNNSWQQCYAQLNLFDELEKNGKLFSVYRFAFVSWPDFYQKIRRDIKVFWLQLPKKHIQIFQLTVPIILMNTKPVFARISDKLWDCNFSIHAQRISGIRQQNRKNIQLFCFDFYLILFSPQHKKRTRRPLCKRRATLRAIQKSYFSRRPHEMDFQSICMDGVFRHSVWHFKMSLLIMSLLSFQPKQ